MLVAARPETIRCRLKARVKTGKAGGRFAPRGALLLAHARDRFSPRAVRLCLSPERATETARRSFKVNSSNRFSALAEAALQSAGHSLPEQHEARFLPNAAEQSFVLSTPPAVVFQDQFISSPTRARHTVGVAHDARYLHACARQ